MYSHNRGLTLQQQSPSSQALFPCDFQQSC
nr:MAG TPA: hypothetical protein [Caudoviricetes sp.]DAQ31974.1 MAG TPA: hypothetical protein [Caudoviricetes sp.]